MTTKTYITSFIIIIMIGLYSCSKVLHIITDRSQALADKTTATRQTREYAIEDWMQGEIQKPGTVALLIPPSVLLPDTSTTYKKYKIAVLNAKNSTPDTNNFYDYSDLGLVTLDNIISTFVTNETGLGDTNYGTHTIVSGQITYVANKELSDAEMTSIDSYAGHAKTNKSERKSIPHIKIKWKYEPPTVPKS